VISAEDAALVCLMLGAKTAKDVSKALNLDEEEAARLLEGLEAKGLAKSRVGGFIFKKRCFSLTKAGLERAQAAAEELKKRAKEVEERLAEVAERGSAAAIPPDLALAASLMAYMGLLSATLLAPLLYAPLFEEDLGPGAGGEISYEA